MIIYKTADTQNELEGILSLQKINLTERLTTDEVQSQGFVTVNHTYEQLKKLNDYEKHIIAKDGDKVIGYTLAMTQNSKSDIPILIPMFNLFNEVVYAGKKITDYTYIVVGQVCVAKEYRGQGIVDNCYAAYKKHYRTKYDFAITEIASTNVRSLNAHYRIGFKEIETYEDPDSTKWVIVLWDWKNNK
jgi:ribosomal protein S18 acetylase RimI-like enzyme